jgi:hypothetical protein
VNVKDNCIDDDPHVVFIKDEDTEDRVGATDTGAAGGQGACVVHSGGTTQELEPISTAEGLACLNLLRDVATNAGLSACDFNP